MLKSIERILVPIDYSEPAFHAAWIAFSIARSIRASMTLIRIHIQEEALRELVFIGQSELAGLTDEKFNDLLQTIVGDPSYKTLETLFVGVFIRRTKTILEEGAPLRG